MTRLSRLSYSQFDYIEYAFWTWNPICTNFDVDWKHYVCCLPPFPWRKKLLYLLSSSTLWIFLKTAIELIALLYHLSPISYVGYKSETQDALQIYENISHTNSYMQTNNLLWSPVEKENRIRVSLYELLQHLGNSLTLSLTSYYGFPQLGNTSMEVSIC